MHIISKIFIKSNGAPRPWLKRFLFDQKKQIKKYRKLFIENNSQIAKALKEWHKNTLSNPSFEMDPEWLRHREFLIESGAFKKVKSFSIVTPPATIYVANMLKWKMGLLNLKVDILDVMPENYDVDLYIVICPQYFKKLPPREKRIVFQMEQSISRRWFTDEYIDVLYNSLCAFDYSEFNINFMRGSFNYSRLNLYHVPIEPMPKNALCSCLCQIESSKKYNVLFYGDIKNKRRRKFIDILSKKFDIKLVSNLYGVDLGGRRIIKKVIVRIHYYVNELLETTRISECLTLGIPVVSEIGSDQYLYKDKFRGVIFTPIDDPQAMLQEVEKILEKNLYNNSEERVVGSMESLGKIFNELGFSINQSLH